MNKILSWDVYEVTTKGSLIQGVMFRGRVRKFALQNKITILTENASDKENTVRFAVLAGEPVNKLEEFIRGLVDDSQIFFLEKNLQNPVLSKMKVNLEERYTI